MVDNVNGIDVEAAEVELNEVVGKGHEVVDVTIGPRR